MSFYRSFASKDELVAEYLRGEERKGWQLWDDIVADHPGDPRLRSSRCSICLVKNTCKDDSRGLRARQCCGGKSPSPIIRHAPW